MADRPVLRARGIQFGYRRKHPLLRDLDLEVHAGEIVGITGENGTGKSTLLKLLVGLLRPQEGTIGHQGRLGYSPQDLLLFDHLSVRENFRVFGRGMGLSHSAIRHQTDDLMERLQFAQYCDTPVRDLSGGTAQKLNFALALLGDPAVLILDEPYQGMDHASFLAFWEMQRTLRRHGRAIIIVSHLIEDRERFSRTLHLVGGRLDGCQGDRCPHCGGTP